MQMVKGVKNLEDDILAYMLLNSLLRQKEVEQLASLQPLTDKVELLFSLVHRVERQDVSMRWKIQKPRTQTTPQSAEYTNGKRSEALRGEKKRQLCHGAVVVVV